MVSSVIKRPQLKRDSRLRCRFFFSVAAGLFVAYWVTLAREHLLPTTYDELTALVEEETGKKFMHSSPRTSSHSFLASSQSGKQGPTTTETEGRSSFWQQMPEWLKPVNCTDLLQQDVAFDAKNRKDLPIEDSNGGQFYARYTNTTRPFWISLHKEEIDKVRWALMAKGKYYEFALSRIFEHILYHSPANARVLDVGGNIGWFTFLSASMKHHVDVFEPLPINLVRLCQSKHLNNWHNEFSEWDVNHRKKHQSSIHIHPYGVNHRPSVASVKLRRFNPGATKVAEGRRAKAGSAEDLDVPLVTLDDFAYDLGWFTAEYGHVKIAILKIDIEGSEAAAVEGARHLLHSGMVENIFLEMNKGNTPEKKRQVEEMILSIFQAGYRLHQWGGWIGPNRELPEDFPWRGPTVARVKFITTELFFRQDNQSNLWFKRAAPSLPPQKYGSRIR